jgi:hypothetical protein
MFILGLAMFGFGYALVYYAANIFVSAYTKTTPMNPAPFTTLLGFPGAPSAAGTAPNGQPQSQAGADAAKAPPQVTGGAGA